MTILIRRNFIFHFEKKKIWSLFVDSHFLWICYFYSLYTSRIFPECLFAELTSLSLRKTSQLALKPCRWRWWPGLSLKNEKKSEFLLVPSGLIYAKLYTFRDHYVCFCHFLTAFFFKLSLYKTKFFYSIINQTK